MKKFTAMLIMSLLLLGAGSAVAQAKSSTQLIFDNAIFGAAIGAISALGIGLIGNNLGGAPWAPAIGIGIFGGMAVGVYEMSEHPGRYADIHYDSTLVAGMPASIAELRL